MLTLKCPNQSLGPRLLLPFHKGPVLLCIIALGGLLRQLLQNLLSSFVSPPVQTLNKICSPPGFRDFQNLTSFSFIHPYITLCSGIFFVPGILLDFWDRDRAQQSRHGLNKVDMASTSRSCQSNHSTILVKEKGLALLAKQEGNWKRQTFAR